ncbi:MAG: HD domain-containing protein [Deltaproteobacteria bacterium]
MNRIIPMRTPSKEECFKLMWETGMLPNIVAHSLRVCLVATFLANHLEEHGIDLDGDLVQTSALLHDITKTRSLTTGEFHALTGAEFIGRIGYPDVAYIVGHHVILDENNVSDKPLCEAEIVNYADKRVLHDRVVSLQERMDYILDKYAKHPGDRERIARNWLRAKDLERKVFGFLPFSPDDLNGLSGSDNLSAAITEYRVFCSRFLVQASHASISFDEIPSIRVNSPK